MAETKGNNPFIIPILAGTLGAIIMLFFAPRSGKESREKLRTKTDSMKRQAKNSITDMHKALDQSLQETQDLKKRISEAIKQTNKKTEEEIKELGEDRDRIPAPINSSVLSTWEEEV